MITILPSFWLISRVFIGRQRTATMTEEGASVDEPFSTMLAILTLSTAPLSLSIPHPIFGLLSHNSERQHQQHQRVEEKRPLPIS